MSDGTQHQMTLKDLFSKCKTLPATIRELTHPEDWQFVGVMPGSDYGRCCICSHCINRDSDTMRLPPHAELAIYRFIDADERIVIVWLGACQDCHTVHIATDRLVDRPLINWLGVRP